MEQSGMTSYGSNQISKAATGETEALPETPFLKLITSDPALEDSKSTTQNAAAIQPCISSPPISVNNKTTSGLISPAPMFSLKQEDDETRQLILDISRLMVCQRFVIIYNGIPFYYNGSYYFSDDPLSIQGVVGQFIYKYGENPTPELVKNCINQSKIFAYQYGIKIMPNDPHFFLYANTLVETSSGVCYPNMNNYFGTGEIEANFLPQAPLSHPTFDAFIAQCANGDPMLIQRLWEMIAYVISPDYSQRVIFCLIGVGGSGKSLLLKFLSRLLSPTLQSHLSIKDLTERNQFTTSVLSGKRVNFSSDEGNLKLDSRSAALLKEISGGGETITANVKFKPHTTFTCTAKLVIATNNAIHDDAAGFDPYLKARMIVIPFVNAVPPEKRDVCLIDKLLIEKDAIVTEAFYVYQKLVQNNYRFSGDNTYFDELATNSVRNSSISDIALFSSDHCMFDGQSFSSTDELFKAFKNAFPYSRYSDKSAFSTAFGRFNSNRVISYRSHTSNENIRGYKGVILK